MSEMFVESHFERIPVARFGADHASTLAYIETVCTEQREFGIGHDPHMRVSRRHFRIFCEAFGEKAAVHVHGRAFTEFGYRGHPITAENGTRLRDGSVVAGHDDWDCLEDLAAVGLLELGPNLRDRAITARLTPKGQKLAAALRAHKQSGGTFSSFPWTTNSKGGLKVEQRSARRPRRHDAITQA